MRRSSLTLALTLGALVVAAPSFAQTPTEAQQKALRANCPSDFRQYCSGVPTGGMDALVCLEKNVDKLSSGCKSAVEAIDPSASTTTATAPTSDAPTAAPAAAPSAAATPPTPTESIPPAAGTASHEPQVTIRQEMALAAGACAVDFRLFCPNLPVGHGNILFCLRVHGPRLAPACREALVKAGVPVR